MNQEKLICKTRKKFKATTDSNHKLPIAPNLLSREFKVGRPNLCYVGDITYIATVIDLYSRKVVGWSMADNMKADLVNNALMMAIWQRKPPKGLVWHTDRGSQYASVSHLKIIKQHGIIQSMSRKGNCWDNAVAESFFHTLKNELIYQCKFKTREEARNVIFEYI
jgi:transposase InsO family protein